jgi:hypothetical protein
MARGRLVHHRQQTIAFAVPGKAFIQSLIRLAKQAKQTDIEASRYSLFSL